MLPAVFPGSARDLKLSGQAAIHLRISGALSEAVARAARERSEQEREAQRCAARRRHLSAWPLTVGHVVGLSGQGAVHYQVDSRHVLRLVGGQI